MKRQWDAEELVENFTLLPTEMALLSNKSEDNRLGFAIQGQHRLHDRPPKTVEKEVFPPAVVERHKVKRDRDQIGSLKVSLKIDKLTKAISHTERC